MNEYCGINFIRGDQCSQVVKNQIRNFVGSKFGLNVKCQYIVYVYVDANLWTRDTNESHENWFLTNNDYFTLHQYYICLYIYFRVLEWESLVSSFTSQIITIVGCMSVLPCQPLPRVPYLQTLLYKVLCKLPFLHFLAFCYFSVQRLS